MIGPLTYLDLGVLAIAAISGLLALYRGLTRELLAILSWIIAGLAVLYFLLNHRKFAEEIAVQMGFNPAESSTGLYLAQGVVGIIIFVIMLILVHLITMRISDTILDSQIGMIDRILGFIFGLARGFVIVVIPYMLALQFWPTIDTEWPVLRDAKTRPYITSTGESLKSFLNAYIVPIIEREKNKEEASGLMAPQVHSRRT
ncbi:MAG: CvpA family protein [Alphaproteobacteria bacterium]|nr:CvpA family protein [Alphaproteobacteria bacterium]